MVAVGVVLAAPAPAQRPAPAPALVAVVAAALAPEQVLTLHLALGTRHVQAHAAHSIYTSHLQTRDVAVAEVFAELLDLLQLEQVYPE